VNRIECLGFRFDDSELNCVVNDCHYVAVASDGVRIRAALGLVVLSDRPNVHEAKRFWPLELKAHGLWDHAAAAVPFLF
jgi:hypothetical protein